MMLVKENINIIWLFIVLTHVYVTIHHNPPCFVSTIGNTLNGISNCVCLEIAYELISLVWCNTKQKRSTFS